MACHPARTRSFGFRNCLATCSGPGYENSKWTSLFYDFRARVRGGHEFGDVNLKSIRTNLGLFGGVV
jgi:hypothetical protein